METKSASNIYKNIFEIIPAPCIIVKTDLPQFTVVDVNQQYLDITKDKKEYLIGKSFLESLHHISDEDDDDTVLKIARYQDIFTSLLHTKQAVRHEITRFDIWNPQENRFHKKYCNNVSYPIFDEYGSIVLILVYILEVTEKQNLIERESSLIESSLLKSEFYESVFIQSPVGIGIWEGPNFITKKINPALTEFFGQEPETIIGKPIFDIFPKSKNLWESILSKVYETGEPNKGIELPVDLDFEGREKRSYVNFGMVPYINPEGKLTGVLGVSVDITQQVQLRKTLEENELKMKIAVESAKLGLWDVDLRSRQVFSSSYIWIPGFPMDRGSYSLQDFIDTLLPEYKEVVVNAFNGLVDNFSVQVQVKWSDQSIHWIQLTGNLLKDEQGNALRMVGTTLDITEQKELDRRKDELLSTVSHELKTPVTSIKAIAQMLERRFDHSDDKPTADLLHKLVNQVRRLTNLIHDLLDASLIEGGKLQLNKTHFLFDELVEEIVSEIQRTTIVHTITICCHTPIPCFSDQERIRQVLINLLTNAIKYSPKADQVKVSVTHANQRILCSVEDFGVGIAMDKAGQIFERFYRVMDDKHSGFQGIGIGLYISSQIINRLDGKIWFDSKEHGTIFSFEVPQF